ncbi:MAG: DUF192 domain-containing protein [bacterium]|nr:DUF192 domain-containing protein [bacterium]
MDKSRITLYIVGIILIALAWAGGGHDIMNYAPYYVQRALGKSATVQVQGQTLKVEVERSDRARAKGLSGRRLLVANRGMLFLFDKVGSYEFWMKDMRFSIDIVWIAQGKIVDISRNVIPPKVGDTPARVLPRVPADTVLEVSAGVAAQWQLDDAVTITFDRFLHYGT